MEARLLTTLPGIRDILPEEMPRWHRIEKSARQIFSRYGFQEIRTPILEATELFARGIGLDTDIVGKEMYTFTDQSGKSITLRPEATASVVRAYAEHHMYRAGGVQKLYYIGPMFRHEKKQKGRWRQFYQMGAEVLGSDHPAIESEVIELVLELLDHLGVETRLWVNSVGCPLCRPAYLERLRRELTRDLSVFCEDCRRRALANPLRVFDCKVETCQPHIERLPKITENLGAECATHFDAFQSYLRDAGITYEIVPRLVRGLDYYVRTAFEIVSGRLGAQNALVGGGRYDGLSEVLGGPPASGFGFALGLDRLVMLLPERPDTTRAPQPDLFLAHLGEPAFRRAQEIARRVRRQGLVCIVPFGGGSLKSQMRQANKLGARNVLIVGDEELLRDRYPVKRMDSATQTELSVEELLVVLKNREGASGPPQP
ncbi:MAG: histidine--tRNA ligase [Acidobacteria bacterium]|nr:MAG: histidine--tRNA ligase [Acidobacteriota bacterium]